MNPTFTVKSANHSEVYMCSPVCFVKKYWVKNKEYEECLFANVRIWFVDKILQVTAFQLP